MQHKLNINLFRFNYKTDYLPYYKKYSISCEEQESVYNLLEKVYTIDQFGFDIKDECYVRINGLFLCAKTLIQDVVKHCGRDWTIEPISKYRAKIDLVIDIQDYIDKVQLFNKYLTKVELDSFSRKYILEYYSSNTLNFKKDYIGDHNLLIAYEIIKNDDSLKNEIVKILKNEKDGIWYHTSLHNRLFKDADISKKIYERLFSFCDIEIGSDFKICLEEQNIDIKQSFSDFNIATYNNTNNIFFNQNLQKSGAKYIILESGGNDLALYSQKNDKDFSLKIAGEILLEAKDKNADFLIVCNTEELDIFDKKQKMIEKLVGRDINLPVITQEQFMLLLNGEKDIQTLGFQSHKIKVTFLDY